MTVGLCRLCIIKIPVFLCIGLRMCARFYIGLYIRIFDIIICILWWLYDENGNEDDNNCDVYYDESYNDSYCD